MGACMLGFHNCDRYHGLMQADWRISIKDYRRGKTLKGLLTRPPFGPRQFFVRMNGVRWPAAGQPVSLTRVVTALRKALVKSCA
jgi:hypothetical protein